MSEPAAVRAAVPANRRAATDLAIALGWFCVCLFTVPFVDPMLRRGRGLTMVFALAAYQFTFEGLVPLFIMSLRRERFSDYGFTSHALARSLGLGLLLTVLYDLGMSWHAGALLWVPLRRQPAIRMSLGAGFPLAMAGIAATVASWGFFEAFFGVFFARKFNQALGRPLSGWLSPGVLAFALFNGLIHLTVGQGVHGFVASFASGYAIAVIPAVTGNAWGSPLVQTLTNAVGKI